MTDGSVDRRLVRDSWARGEAVRRYATVRRAFEVDGVGVHSGRAARIRVGPAPWGSGIRFHRWEADDSVPALLRHAEVGLGCTILRGDGLTVGTPEHLLAALHGCGVSDARIDIDGPEVPILDGSARPWCGRLREVGLREGPARRWPILPHPVRVELDEAWAEAAPADGLILRVEVDFGEEGPAGEAEITLPGRFCEEVAWARTFALERDVARLLAAGRGRGATSENTVIYGASGPIGAVRGPDEGVRHKLLDLVGDLALLGAPVGARIVAHRGSHALHHRLVGAILAAIEPSAPASEGLDRSAEP